MGMEMFSLQIYMPLKSLHLSISGRTGALELSFAIGMFYLIGPTLSE